MTTLNEQNVHLFESAGLGKAPFRIVAVVERRGPIRQVLPDGIVCEVGAPNQPMGCCKYCYTGIATCYVIRSADGKEFDVGCECVRKTDDKGLKKAVNKHVSAARKASEDKRIAEFSEKFKDPEFRAKLAAIPHPQAWCAEKGETMLDNIEWLWSRSGNAGKIRIIRKWGK